VTGEFKITEMTSIHLPNGSGMTAAITRYRQAKFLFEFYVL